MCDVSEGELAEYLAWVEAATARAKAERLKAEKATHLVRVLAAPATSEPVAA